MNEKITKTKIKVKDNLINVIKINNTDYISLTDLARYKNINNPGDVIIKWMCNKSSFDFYSLWEELNVLSNDKNILDIERLDNNKKVIELKQL